MNYVGVDIHKRYSVLVAVDERGQELRRGRDGGIVAVQRCGEDGHNLTVPESRVVLRNTIRNFSDLLESEAAHLSEPP